MPRINHVYPKDFFRVVQATVAFDIAVNGLNKPWPSNFYVYPGFEHWIAVSSGEPDETTLTFLMITSTQLRLLADTMDARQVVGDGEPTFTVEPGWKTR